MVHIRAIENDDLVQGWGPFQRILVGFFRYLEPHLRIAQADTLHPKPYTLHPKPYTLHPEPYTPHPSPYTLHPTPYTLHSSTSYTLRPTPYTLHPSPFTLHRPSRPLPTRHIQDLATQGQILALAFK